MCDESNLDFTPMSFESTGGMSNDTCKILSYIGKCLNDRLQDPLAKKQLFERISLVLQRGNAFLLTNRVVYPSNGISQQFYAY